MKKIMLFGLLAGLVMFVANYVFSFFFNLAIPVNQEYSGNPAFRPWSDPLMSLIFLHPFIVGIILAWFWTKLKPVLDPARKKAWIYFAFAYWIFAFPGMLISYSTFPISISMVLNWYLGILVQSICASLIYQKFLK